MCHIPTMPGMINISTTWDNDRGRGRPERCSRHGSSPLIPCIRGQCVHQYYSIGHRVAGSLYKINPRGQRDLAGP